MEITNANERNGQYAAGRLFINGKVEIQKIERCYDLVQMR